MTVVAARALSQAPAWIVVPGGGWIDVDSFVADGVVRRNPPPGVW
jgi:hypothetical protein